MERGVLLRAGRGLQEARDQAGGGGGEVTKAGIRAGEGKKYWE